MGANAQTLAGLAIVETIPTNAITNRCRGNQNQLTYTPQNGDSYMIISAKWIVKPRREYKCSTCARQMTMHARLYGAAHERDRPYVIRVCADCTIESTDITMHRKLEASMR